MEEYTYEIGPEFPANGEWACPVFAFDHDGQVVDDFVSRWGAPAVVRVRPAETAEWVGQFPSGGLGGVSDVFAGPAPKQMCVVVVRCEADAMEDSPESFVVDPATGERRTS